MSASRSAKSSLVSLVLVAAAGVAAAQEKNDEDPSPVQASIDTPAEWPEQPELADGIAKQLGKAVDFGGLEKVGGASAFVRPQTGIIYVTWLATTEPAEKPEAAIRAALDQLRASTEGGGETEELDYIERRAGPAIEVKRVWRHVPNQTITMSRSFFWKSPDSKLRLVRGECVFAETDQKTVAPVCEKALSTLTAEAIAGGGAGELGAVAGPEPLAAGSALDAGSEGPSLGPANPDTLPSELYRDDKKREGRSNLWLFVVGGILIVSAFWIMTRKKDSPAPGGHSEEEE